MKTKVIAINTLAVILAILTISCTKQEKQKIVEKVNVRLVVMADNATEFKWGVSSKDINVVKIYNYQNISLDTTLNIDNNLTLSVYFTLKDLPEIQFRSLIEVYKNDVLIKKFDNAPNANLVVHLNE